MLKIEKETFLLVIVYCMPGSLGSFIDDFTLLINELPVQHNMLIVGNLNLDQMLQEHVARILTCLRIHNIQLIHGGILDLVFDTSNPNIVSSLPSLYSDHLVLFFQI